MNKCNKDTKFLSHIIILTKKEKKYFKTAIYFLPQSNLYIYQLMINDMESGISIKNQHMFNKR